jgi:hypothetical protein
MMKIGLLMGKFHGVPQKKKWEIVRYPQNDQTPSVQSSITWSPVFNLCSTCIHLLIHLILVAPCCDLPLEANTPLIFQRLQGTLPGQGQSFPELLRQIEAPASQCAERCGYDVYTMSIRCLYDVHMLCIVICIHQISSMHKHTVEIQGRPTAEGTGRCVEKASKSSRSRQMRFFQLRACWTLAAYPNGHRISNSTKLHGFRLHLPLMCHISLVDIYRLIVWAMNFGDLWRSLEIFGCASAAKERETGRDSPWELRGFSDSSWHQASPSNKATKLHHRAAQSDTKWQRLNLEPPLVFVQHRLFRLCLLLRLRARTSSEAQIAPILNPSNILYPVFIGVTLC